MRYTLINLVCPKVEEHMKSLFSIKIRFKMYESTRKKCTISSNFRFVLNNLNSPTNKHAGNRHADYKVFIYCPDCHRTQELFFYL